MEDIIIRSPNLLHKVALKYIGEIRFGPAYYSLTIDKLVFGDRIFGNAYLWSPNSRFFAVQEWETTSEGRGPQTRLLLVDLRKEMECVLSRADGGFIVPKQFDGDKLIYTKKYLAKGIESEFEIQFLTLNRWEDLQ